MGRPWSASLVAITLPAFCPVAPAEPGEGNGSPETSAPAVARASGTSS